MREKTAWTTREHCQNEIPSFVPMPQSSHTNGLQATSPRPRRLKKKPRLIMPSLRIFTATTTETGIRRRRGQKARRGSRENLGELLGFCERTKRARTG